MRNASFGGLIIAALLVCYLINCFSPLRLEYDSIHYFSLKDCLEGTCPPGFRAADDPHPYGYPLLLWFLSRVGVLHPFTIAFVNLLFLAGALYFTGKLLGPMVGVRSRMRLTGEKAGLSGRRLELGVILLLLSWPFIKFFSYPLSEMQYLFFSCGSLFFFRLYTDRGRRPGALVLSMLFAGLAILTRTVGVALAPALLAGLVWHHRLELAVRVKAVLTRLGWWAGWIVFGGIGLLVWGANVISARLHPGLYMNSVRHAGAGWKVLLREHLSEWGQLLLNTPMGKVAGVGQGVIIWLFIVAGLLLVFVVLYALVRWRKKVPVAASVYLVIYCLLIFYWPFYDVRFWIPVAPLVVMILLHGRYARFFRWLVALYILAGAGAVGYSTYTAFNREALARTQAGGRYRNEYETYFFGRPLRDTTAPADPYVLHVLETCK